MVNLEGCITFENVSLLDVLSKLILNLVFEEKSGGDLY